MGIAKGGGGGLNSPTKINGLLQMVLGQFEETWLKEPGNCFYTIIFSLNLAVGLAI